MNINAHFNDSNENIYHQMVANTTGCNLEHTKTGDCLRNLDTDIIVELGTVRCCSITQTFYIYSFTDVFFYNADTFIFLYYLSRS